MADDLFEGLPLCVWRVRGKPDIPLSVQRIVEDFEGGVVERNRPFRKGAKLDNLSRRKFIWTLEILFVNNSEEPGISQTDNYPNTCNDFCASAEIEETGTLVLGTRGPVRCQIKTYRRTEDAELRDAALVTATFWEDNEDQTSTTSFTLPLARSSSVSLAGSCVDACLEAGVYSDDVAALNTLAAGLEQLANAPFEFSDDMQAQAQAVISTANRVIDTFADRTQQAVEETAGILLHPENCRAVYLLRSLIDTAARSVPAVPAGERTPKPVVTTRPATVFQLAKQHGQTIPDLLRLNKKLAANPYRVPAGTTVRIF